MDILGILMAHNTVLAGVLLLVLGLWTYFHRREKPVHQTFAALLISAALWLFTLVLWRGASDPRQQAFWIRTLFFAGAFLPIFFQLFTLAFIGRFPRTRAQLLYVFPAVVLYVIAYHSSLLVDVSSGVPTVAHVGRAIFATHFAIGISSALVAILRELRRDPAFDKGKLAPLLSGAIVSFLAIFVMLFTTGLSRGLAVGRAPEAVVVFALAAGMIAMAWMVDSKKLLSELRPVGGELFILVVIFLVSMDIAVARSPLDLSVRIVVLILLVIYGVVSVRTAARELRRLQEISALHGQLVTVNGRLLDSDKLKTRFVSFALHELRAPISGLRAVLDMLRRGDHGSLTDAQQEQIGRAFLQTDRLNETVETFLNVSKIELGADDPFRTDTDIGELVTRVAEEQRPAAEAKQLELSVAMAVGLPRISCDGGKLHHAVANLVQNAIKYTETGGVSVSVAREGNDVAVRVADSGIGLDDADKEEIRKVIRGDLKSVKFEARGGSGLGMFIVKSIVKAHGGEMYVESPGKGRGSTFGFRIPIS